MQAVLEDVVGQVVDERGERGQEAAFRFGPEVVGLVLLGCGAVGVVHDVGDQAHDRHVGFRGVDVAHGVEFRLAGQVHQVELFDRVAHLLQPSAGLRVEFALRVGAGVVHAAFEDVGDDMVVLMFRRVACVSTLRPSVAVIWRFCLVSLSVYGAISRLVDQRAEPYSSPSRQLRWLMLHR